MSRDSVGDPQEIATELATNSLQYTGGSFRLAFWWHHEHLVCEARDGGRFRDPFVGLKYPSAGGAEGRGLFLVNATADLEHTHHGERHHFRRT